MQTKLEGANAFAVYRGLLSFIGAWPLDEKSTFQTFRYALAVTAQATFMIHTMMEIYLNTGKISAMVDICLFFSSAFLALTKHSYLRVYRETIAENLKSYINDWDDIKDENYLKIMKTHAKVYKLQFIAYNSVGYIGTTCYLLRTILINKFNKRKLPDDDFEYQFIFQTSFLSRDFLTNYYALVMAIQFAQCLYACTSGAGTDCFFFGLVFHLCAQLEILKNEWQKLGFAAVVGAEDQRFKVNALIDRHKELVRLGKNIEASFNRVVLIQLITSVILICMSGCSILVARLENDYVTMLISTNCICFMITESFIYGYASDYLLSQSEQIVQAVYSASWYQFDHSTKNNVLFVMMRARQPLYVTAGKFFYVTRNTFIQLVKTSASYLSVLRLTLEMSHDMAQ